MRKHGPQPVQFHSADTMCISYNLHIISIPPDAIADRRAAFQPYVSVYRSV
jgi:hypothetical protein